MSGSKQIKKKEVLPLTKQIQLNQIIEVWKRVANETIGDLKQAEAKLNTYHDFYTVVRGSLYKILKMKDGKKKTLALKTLWNNLDEFMSED